MTETPGATSVPPSLAPPVEAPDRNLALELVRVTEAAAMAAGRWVGRGDKNGADGAAVNAMRQLIGTVDMDGIVVIGEGEKDEAPMLFNGERIGNGHGPQVDVAVDPLEGTRLTALGRPGAVSVIACAPRGTLYNPQHIFYMEKIAVGPPEGVVAACALKCVEGDFQGRLWARDDNDRKMAAEGGLDLGRVLTIDDLVKGEDVFFAATGVTTGDLLKGVEYVAGGATSE